MNGSHTTVRRRLLRRILLDSLEEGGTALGQLLGVTLSLDTEGLHCLGAGSIAERTGTGIRLGISGDLQAVLVLFFAEDSWRQLACCLSDEVAAGESPSELARSALMESGNLLVSAFLSGLDERLDMAGLPAPPTYVRGTLRDCLAEDTAPGQGVLGMVLPWSMKSAESDSNGSIWLLLPIPACRALLRQTAARSD